MRYTWIIDSRVMEEEYGNVCWTKRLFHARDEEDSQRRRENYQEARFKACAEKVTKKNKKQVILPKGKIKKSAVDIS